MHVNRNERTRGDFLWKGNTGHSLVAFQPANILIYSHQFIQCPIITWIKHILHMLRTAGKRKSLSADRNRLNRMKVAHNCCCQSFQACKPLKLPVTLLSLNKHVRCFSACFTWMFYLQIISWMEEQEQVIFFVTTWRCGKHQIHSASHTSNQSTFHFVGSDFNLLWTFTLQPGNPPRAGEQG